jgi:hypothetical protein
MDIISCHTEAQTVETLQQNTQYTLSYTVVSFGIQGKLMDSLISVVLCN